MGCRTGVLHHNLRSLLGMEKVCGIALKRAPHEAEAK
jgi:hypothetical protein